MATSSSEIVDTDQIPPSPPLTRPTLDHALSRYAIELSNGVARLRTETAFASSAAPIQAREASEPARHPAEQRLLTLANAGLDLADSLEVDECLYGVAQRIVPTDADWIGIEFLDYHGRKARVSSVVPDTTPAPLCNALRKFRIGLQAGCSPRVITAGTPGSGPVKRLFELGVTSLIVAPVRSRRRTLGNLALATLTANRHFSAMDVALANILASLFALTIDNLQLHRAAARAIAARDEFLAVVSQELAAPLCHVKGFASTLRQRDVELAAEVRDDFLVELEREADRLADVMQRLIQVCCTS